MEINPEITSYVGKDEYYMDVLVYREGKLVEEESERGLAIWRPVIATRSLDLTVDVYHGETLVLGGLSDSQISTRLDKIPFLGDLPLIGRLFQSQSEISTRKNMLIFVTARLVNDAGRPTNILDNRTDIPDVNR